MAESCRRAGRQMVVISPGVALVAINPGSCFGPAHGSVRRRGRPPVVRGQLYCCPFYDRSLSADPAPQREA